MVEKSGKCLCGAVSFSVVPKHEEGGVHIEACHCIMCQRQLGGPFIGISLAKAPTIEDDTRIGVYQSSEWAERLFCNTCGTNLFYRFRDGGMYTVLAGSLDDLSDGILTKEIFIDQKPDYYDFVQPTEKMTAAEVIAAFASESTGGQEG